jgi:hypothetical protein
MGAIVTQRLILLISAIIITQIGDYYSVWPCAKLDWTLHGQNKTMSRYPVCASFYDGTNPDQVAVVSANFNGKREQSGSALDASFGMATWMAIFLHAVGVEIYVRKINHPRSVRSYG